MDVDTVWKLMGMNQYCQSVIQYLLGSVTKAGDGRTDCHPPDGKVIVLSDHSSVFVPYWGHAGFPGDRALLRIHEVDTADDDHPQ